ncbi:MAG: hypothetical protein L3J80_02235, partial [Thermoplasmata archaeon]|nr:hypothetical protein [Thermoplasmata archaeon]
MDPPFRRPWTRPTGRHRFADATVLGALAVVVLLAAPAGVSAAPHTIAMGPHPSAARPNAPPAPIPAARGLAGSSGLGPVVDAAKLFRADHSWVFSPNPAPAPAAAHRAPPLGSPAPATALGAHSAGAPGWISGTVEDSVYHTPIAGVSVYFTGACSNCTSQVTNTTGTFKVQSDPGPSQLVFLDLPNYLVNKTFPTVVSSVITPIGVVLLVHLATVTGRVIADLSGTHPVANVNVSSVSRDGALGGPNLTLTLPNGTFSLPVYPLPIEVDFSGSLEFLGNATFADPTPWELVDVGTVYLEGGLNATVSVTDGITGLPVVATATFCSQRIDGGCLPGGSGNGTVPLLAVAGPGIVSVESSGYVTNISQVPQVPNDPTYVPNIAAVRLLPLGSIEVSANFSGGTPNDSWPSALPGDGGGVAIWACSLSGMDLGGANGDGLAGPSCVGSDIALGETTLVPAPPLRDLVLAVQGWGVPNGFPAAIVRFNGPVVGFPNETLLNVSWANVTPNHVTDLGTMNISAGNYLTGTVEAPSDNTSVVSVDSCSTVRANECQRSIKTSALGQIDSVAVGCRTGPWSFCIGADPGPDRLTVDWPYGHNLTWLTVPFGCCKQEDHPIDLGRINNPYTETGPGGTVYGRLGVEGEPASYVPPYGWDIGVEVCPVVAPYPCFSGNVSNANGSFTAAAPLGWDVVTVSGPGYRQNTTWVDVTGNNSTGTIEVGPVASYGGQVVSTMTGYPIFEATIAVCNVAYPHPCYTGTATSSSNGTFNGTVPALPYPSGTFEFVATASGFDSEGAFVNVTPGGRVTVPTLRLPPIGTAGGAPAGGLTPRGANSSSPTAGTWIVGRATDSVSGLGVGNAEITVCALASATGCLPTLSQTFTGGEFNLSTVHGAYEIWINGSHYNPDRVYANASSAGTLDLGQIAIAPLDRVAGRVLIEPWPSLFGTYGEGADQVVLRACNPGGVCGPITATGTDGSFNVSAPAGTPDTLQMMGGGPQGCYGNTLGGFNSSAVVVPVSSPYVTLNGTGPGASVELPILGGVTGFIDQSAGGATPPAWFALYAVSPPGVVGGATGYFVGGGGLYAAFLPAGWSGVRALGSAYGLVPTTSAPSYGTVQEGLMGTGPNVTAAPFGFVTGTLRDAKSLAPLPGTFVSVFGGGTGNGSLSGSATANGTGFVNVTAPPGLDAVATASVAYAPYTGSALVVSGRTDNIGLINLSGLPGGGFGAFRSVEVNTVGVPPTPGAYDNVSGHPVEAMTVVENAPGDIHSLPAYANDLGQYFVGTVPATNATVTFRALGFTPITQTYAFAAGQTRIEPQLNMTANGILAGTVEAEPGNISVAYANVVVCPLSDLSCTNGIQTNATGVFWIAAPAGIDQVSVSSALYLSNLTKLVNVSPDSFNEIGNVPVFSFGT